MRYIPIIGEDIQDHRRKIKIVDSWKGDGAPQKRRICDSWRGEATPHEISENR